MKHALRYILAFVTSLILAQTQASAQSAGSFVVSGGAAWINFARSSAQELQSQSAFGSFTSPGTAAQVHNTFTPQFLFTYFVTDNIAIEGTAGIPPELHLFAQGNAAPLGAGGPSLPLGNLRPLATTRAWAPTVLAKYYFGKAEDNLRPFVGAGVNYTWFTSVHLHPTFEGALSQFAGPGGSVQAAASPSWNPAFAAGATYRFNDHWSLTASVTYIPLKTTARFDAVSQNGTVVLGNRTRITADPIIGFVGIGYRF